MTLFPLRHRLRTTGLFFILVLLAVLVALLTRNSNVPLRGDASSDFVTPSNLMVFAGSVFAEWNNFSPTSAPHFHLQWSHNNPGTPVTFYVQRKSRLFTSGTASDWQTVATVLNNNYFTDTSLAPDTYYAYKICVTSWQCTEDSSSRLGTWSDEVAPEPTGLNSSVLHDRAYPAVELTWKDRGRYGNYDRYQIHVERRYKLSGTAEWGEWADITRVMYIGFGRGVDEAVRPNFEYEYRVRGATPYGRSDYSNVTRRFINNTPPDAPVSCSALPQSPTEIRVGIRPSPEWPQSKAGQAVFYRVYRSLTGLEGGFSYIGPMEPSGGMGTQMNDFFSFTDTGRISGVPYYYAVKAGNDAGESVPCTTSITIPTAPPPVPADLEMTVDGEQKNTTLTWTFVDDTSSGAPIAFSVWHATQEAGPYEKIVSLIPSERSFTAQLRDGAINYFQVKADNGLYESGPSNIVSVTVPPAPPMLGADPVVRTAPLSQTEVRLSWPVNSADDRRIRIERSSSVTPPAFATIHTTTSAAASSFVDSGLSQDTEYLYRIFAFNATGESSPSNTATVRTLPGYVFPPSFLRVTALSGAGILSGGRIVPTARIQLNWWDINNYESGYDIEYSTTGNNNEDFTTFARVGKDIGTFISSDGAGWLGNTFIFRVRASNRGGFSDYTDSVSIFLPSSVPPAPSALEGHFIGNALLNWQISETAHVTSFIVERSENAIDGFETVATVSFDSQCKNSTQGVPGQDCANWNSPALSSGDDFYYRVRARNIIGNSEPSNVVRVTGPPPLPPVVPTNLAAVFVRGNTGGTLLSWTDESDNEEYFEIERKIDAISPDWIPLYSLPADTVDFLDASYSIATLQYRIRAYNQGGFSDWSNVVTYTHPPSSPWSYACQLLKKSTCPSR
jgi:hypothetical protein